MRDAVQQSCGHLGVPENRYPLREGQIGRDDQRGFLVKLTDQMEQQGAP